MDAYIQSLIADYLFQHNLTATLNSFQIELNRKFNLSPVDESLASIISDRIQFNSLSADPIVTPSSILPPWTVLPPTTKTSLHIFPNSLIISSAFAHLILDKLPLTLAIFTSSNHSIELYDIDQNKSLLIDHDLHDQVSIKAVTCILNTDLLITCGMDGLLTVSRLVNEDHNNYRLEKLVSRFKLHNRLVIAMTYLSVSADLGYVSSIGWDSMLVVSRIDLKDSIPKVAIVGKCKLLTKATCILSLIDDESGLPVFLTGRTDSSLLSMFTLFGEIGSETLVEVAKLSLNDAEFSSHSFYPMTMASVGNSRVSIGTNEVPFMRLITVEVPSIREAVKMPEGDLLDRLRRMSDDHNDARIMRDRIVSNLDSFTPQDKYSSPIVLGRGRREGVWIMGDDGIVRGFDLKRGEVVEEMKSEGGRIKSGFVGDIGGDGGKEVVVSCGIDGVVMWR